MIVITELAKLIRRLKIGFLLILRLYGPLQPWFDKTWRPGQIELVQTARRTQ